MDLQGCMQALMKHAICRIPDQNQMEKTEVTVESKAMESSHS